jgi:hypothetical protein
MAGIYTRDNINYSTMLQNAIANRARAAERQAQYIQNQGKLWGDTATNVGKYLGRGIFATADTMGDEDEAELAHLKELKAEQEQKAEMERLNYIKQQADNMRDYEPTPATNASNLMDGYIPSEELDRQWLNTKAGVRAQRYMEGYTPYINGNPYDNATDNPYIYEMMQDYYRRGY